MKRKLILFTILSISAFSLYGCGKSEVEDTINTNSTTTVDSVIDEQEIKEVVEKSPNKVQDSISDDLYSFEVTIDGSKYSFPMLLSEFEKSGWILDSEAKELELEPNQYTIDYVKKGDKEVMVYLANGTQDVLKGSDCYIAGIKVEDTYSDPGIKLTLPKGITHGASKEDVISAYGEPSDTYEGDLYVKLTYESGTYKEIEFTIFNDTKKLNGIEIMNLIDFPKSESKVDSNERLESTSYTAPKELGSDIFSFNVKYENGLYTLPVPFSVLEKDGWVIDRAPVDTISAKDTSFGFVLKKGNQTLRTALYNEFNKATSPENCLVTTILSDDYNSKFEIELPKGIKIGSTKKEVEDAYSSLNPIIDESSNYITYTYRNKVQQEIDIMISKDTNKVSKIEVQFIP